jgi:hypothetical protein
LSETVAYEGRLRARGLKKRVVNLLKERRREDFQVAGTKRDRLWPRLAVELQDL